MLLRLSVNRSSKGLPNRRLEDALRKSTYIENLRNDLQLQEIEMRARAQEQEEAIQNQTKVGTPNCQGVSGST